jgi:hypothetical protein
MQALRTGITAEGDGVLQMLLWLGRSPESFVPGCRMADEASARLPSVSPGQILRFDTLRLYDAVNAVRGERQMSWLAASDDIGLSVAVVTNLSRGGRTAFPQVMRLVRWLRRPAAEFVRVADR